MKPVHEMTDEDLNYWIAMNIMGFCKPENALLPFWLEQDGGIALNNEGGWHLIKSDKHECPSFEFNPTKNLNHTYLMEYKIMEMGRDGEYTNKLSASIFYSEDTKEDTKKFEILFKILHASSRQRCEAAYLTFNKDII